MELNEDQGKKLGEFLRKHLTPAPKCSICGQRAWSVSNRVYECREFFKGGLRIGGGSVIPFILMTCGNCGHTLFFNALKAGIIEPEEGKKREPKET